MQRMAGPRHVVDPSDPRAPSQAVWDALSAAERAAVLDSLPVEVPLELHPPEGDVHHDARQGARDALKRYFRSIGKRIYVSGELGVYYPQEPRFCPDVLAVLDVADHRRDSWVVSAEGRGLDFVLEVHWKGDEHKDLELNVERYARLGISEYFVLDLRRGRLMGHRLASPSSRAYQAMLPQHGRLPSMVLGLDLLLEGDLVRFYAGTAPLPEADELIGKLQRMLDDLVTRRQEAEERAALEAQLRTDAERRVAELEAELAKLRTPPRDEEGPR
jgi:Uma2 family endonuclease